MYASCGGLDMLAICLYAINMLSMMDGVYILAFELSSTDG